MAFWGNYFSFNDVPCQYYDLMIYDVGSTAQGECEFASCSSIIEDAVASKWRPYFYGTRLENKLEFSMVFGVNQNRIDSGRYLNRNEMDAIATWLTGHNKYMILEIEQEDMRWYRYRCMVTELRAVEYGNIPWAFEAHITCDSPFAYSLPYKSEYRTTAGEELIVSFSNDCSYNGFYSPVIEIDGVDDGGMPTIISIANDTDESRTFTLGSSDAELPTDISHIAIDNDLCTIVCDTGENLYKYTNFNFLRLKRGYNTLRINTNADAIIKVKCEFPVNIGG